MRGQAVRPVPATQAGARGPQGPRSLGRAGGHGPQEPGGLPEVGGLQLQHPGRSGGRVGRRLESCGALRVEAACTGARGWGFSLGSPLSEATLLPW